MTQKNPKLPWHNDPSAPFAQAWDAVDAGPEIPYVIWFDGILHEHGKFDPRKCKCGMCRAFVARAKEGK